MLGIGHTNAHVVREWMSNPIADCDLVCVSKFPTATYSGMLPGTLGGQFDDDEWRIDLAALCDRAGAKLILAEASGLDLDQGELHFQSQPSIRF
jgi:NADH dehydrogenase FAD-containing subunit